jgi:hypothetical protein
MVEDVFMNINVRIRASYMFVSVPAIATAYLFTPLYDPCLL